MLIVWRPCGACFFTCRFKAQQQRKKKNAKCKNIYIFAEGAGQKWPVMSSTVKSPTYGVSGIRTPESSRANAAKSCREHMEQLGFISEDEWRRFTIPLLRQHNADLFHPPPPSHVHTLVTSRHSTLLATVFPCESLRQLLRRWGVCFFLLHFFLVHTCTVWLPFFWFVYRKWCRVWCTVPPTTGVPFRLFFFRSPSCPIMYPHDDGRECERWREKFFFLFSSRKWERQWH